ncbi:dienelactone hydrolase family protein [Brevundimonas sp.]|uniref:dienelactone hydrolase family protein n=1 Tax=Brevundimonas sp. TaxID=1871086 RepID=UPI003D6CE36D
MPTRRAAVGVLGGVALATLGGGAVAQVAPFEGVTFDSGGKSIRAIYYPAQGDARGSGVVMMHGSGVRIRSAGPWHELALRFASDGYAVLTPLFVDAAPDDGRRPAPVMAAWRRVGLDGADWLASRAGVAPERIGLFGYSLGSYVAVDGALGGGRTGAAIGLAGGVDVYTPRNPRRHIPVLVIRAENDTHVKPLNTAAWVDFMRDHEVPVRVQTLQGAGHLLSARQWAEVFTRSSEFFDGNIGRR